MNKVTIDQLIAKLQEAKAAIGGDKTVTFWLHRDDYTFTPAFNNDVECKIAGDNSNIEFEIQKISLTSFLSSVTS